MAFGGICKGQSGKGAVSVYLCGIPHFPPRWFTCLDPHWAPELPVEEAWLVPEHHHHIAACIQVGACDGDLCAPRHGSPTGLQVCKSQGLRRKEED